MRKGRYPADWARIARAEKERAGWRCAHCSRSCQRPGEGYRGGRYVLTVAHLDHDPENPDARLLALCAPCHL